jgi:hypothetical protein
MQGVAESGQKILSLRESPVAARLPALTRCSGFTMLRHFLQSVAERVIHEGRRR